MAWESKPVYKGKVTIGTDLVLGMGVWSWSGFSREMIEDLEFFDDYDDYVAGLVRCGKVTFSGQYKKDDSRGQTYLISCMLNGTELTSIRFWVDASSYYIPNSTSSTAAIGGLPANTPVGHVKVESVDINYSGLGALGDISFVVQLCKAPLRFT